MDRAIAPHLKPMFETKLQVSGRPCAIVLRIPRYGEIYDLISVIENEESRRLDVCAHLEHTIASVNGEEPTRAFCEALYDDPEARAKVLAARSWLFEGLLSEGRLYALCPHCEAAEVVLTLPALASQLRSSPPAIFLNGLEMDVPALAIEQLPPIRPIELSYIERLRFELPTSVVGLSSEQRTGTLLPLDVERESAIKEEEPWADEAVDDDEEELDDCCSGFDAMLALSLTLRDFGPDGNEITLQMIRRLSTVDFFFLDNLHRLTSYVDVFGDSAQSTCGACRSLFVPVRDVPLPEQPAGRKHLHHSLIYGRA